MTRALVNAYRFHFENDGYIVGFRAACALRAARAELAASELDWTYEWEWDDCPDLSWMSEEERAKDHEVLVCMLRNVDGEVIACVGGVTDPDRNYRRVIEAELAMEADAVEVLASRQDEVASGLTAESFA